MFFFLLLVKFYNFQKLLIKKFKRKEETHGLKIVFSC